MSPVYSVLEPLSDALATTLRVSGLLTLAPGGVWDVVPQTTSFPFVLVEVLDTPAPSLGRRSGLGPGSMYTVDVRVRVFSQDYGMKTAQAAMAKVVELLVTPSALSVTGYTVCSLQPINEGRSTPFFDDVIAGKVCRGVSKDFQFVLEEAA